MNEKRLSELYVKAIRTFVDYENYSKASCIFYYRLLKQVNIRKDTYTSNYFIAGLEQIINRPSFRYKELLLLRFWPENDLTVSEIADKISLSKQGLLQRYEEVYNYIRKQDEMYDIAKRIAMLEETTKQLQDIRNDHAEKYMTSAVGIEALGLKKNTCTCLKAAGIDTIAKFANLTPERASEIPGVGSKLLEDIMKRQRLLLEQSEDIKYQGITLNIEELSLTERAMRCLNQLGIDTIEGFMKLTKKQVMSIWHVGEATWKEISDKQKTLKFGLEV